MRQKTLFDSDLTLEEARELIKNGADVNMINQDGITPLFFVLNVEIAQLLIENGANVNHRNRHGKTLLHMDGSLEIMQLLLQHNAYIDIQDEDGYTPLHLQENIDITRLLINHDADVNSVDNENYTPLQWYIHYRSIEKIALFLAAGADINHLSESGTVLSLIYTKQNDIPNSNDVSKFVIENGGIASDTDTYMYYREFFTEKQQNAFDSFLLLTSDDNNEFFHMCLSYQESIKNNVKIDIKDMDIL
jgi:ankyrin repeat protein